MRIPSLSRKGLSLPMALGNNFTMLRVKCEVRFIKRCVVALNSVRLGSPYLCILFMISLTYATIYTTLQWSRKGAKTSADLLTDYAEVNYQKRKIGRADSVDCRFCWVEEKTTGHILCGGEALSHIRRRILGLCFTEKPSLKAENTRIYPNSGGRLSNSTQENKECKRRYPSIKSKKVIPKSNINNNTSLMFSLNPWNVSTCCWYTLWGVQIIHIKDSKIMRCTVGSVYKCSLSNNALRIIVIINKMSIKIFLFEFSIWHFFIF